MNTVSTICADTSVLQAQIALLKACADSVGGSLKLDAFRQQLARRLDRVFLDVVHGDCVTARRADGTYETRYVLRFGAEFERLLSAFRTGEFDD